MCCLLSCVLLLLMLAKRQSGQWMSFRCVPVGKLVAHIVEFEQVGLPRAAYGKKLLLRLAESLTGEFEGV